MTKSISEIELRLKGMDALVERHKKGLIAYAKTCSRLSFEDVYSETLSSCVEAVLNGREMTIERMFSTMRSIVIKRRLSVSEKTDGISLDHEPVMKQLESTDKLVKFSMDVDRELKMLEDDEHFIFGVYLRYFDEIPKTKGKFQTLWKLVKQDADPASICAKYSVEEIEKIWRSALSRMRRKLKQYWRNN